VLDQDVKVLAMGALERRIAEINSLARRIATVFSDVGRQFGEIRPCDA